MLRVTRNAFGRAGLLCHVCYVAVTWTCLWLLRDCYVMLRLLCYVRCTNRMGKMTPGTNPKPELYRVVRAK